jgi:hypothetical protein
MTINHHHNATDPPEPVPARRPRRNERERLLACAAVAATNAGVAHIRNRR